MIDYSHLRGLASLFETIVLSIFPPKTGGVGRPRFRVEKMFWVLIRILCRGWTWREVPRRYGARSALHDWFKKLVFHDVFFKVWQRVLDIKWTNMELTLKLQSIDVTTILAPGLWGNQAVRSYRYRPKRAIKVSCLVDQKGAPLAAVLGGANDHDSKLLKPTLQSKSKVLENRCKSTLLGDKAYTGYECRLIAERHGYSGIFVPRENQRRQLTKRQSKIVNQFRWVVERTFAWLKSKKRLTQCRDHRIENCLGFLHLGLAVIAFQTQKR